MKATITALLALGVSFAAPVSSKAAAVMAPLDGVRAALATTDGIQLAQVPPGRVAPGAGAVRVAPRGGAVVRGGPGVAGGGAVMRGGPGVVRGGPVVRGGAVVGRPGVGVVGRPGFVGRPAYVGRPAFVRAYRPWVRRPYFGRIIGGVALGTILTVAAVGVAPAYAPDPDLCWYWADSSLTRGYWDYCG
jgi:hypothetical protein